jgi:hypothetical protein
MAFKPSLLPSIMLASALVLGVLSAQYMMDNATSAARGAASQWTEINLAPDTLSATYLAGHFMRRGQVPPPKGSRMFVRRLDDDGNSLRGDCVVTVAGKFPESRSWFLAASSGADRTTLDVAQTVTETSGETAVSVSTTPVPGNWLIPPRNGSYEMQLLLLGTDAPSGPGLNLPRVKRLWC